MTSKYTHEVAQEIFRFDSSPQSKISVEDIPCWGGFGSCYEGKIERKEKKTKPQNNQTTQTKTDKEKYKTEQKIDCGGVIIQEVKIKKLLDTPHYNKLASVLHLLQNSRGKHLVIAYAH